jgi:hypothetical protein
MWRGLLCGRVFSQITVASPLWYIEIESKFDPQRYLDAQVLRYFLALHHRYRKHKFVMMVDASFGEPARGPSAGTGPMVAARVSASLPGFTSQLTQS